MNFKISGQLIDLHQRRIYPAAVTVADSRITQIKELNEAPGRYLLPGFIDAHVHIESSMLVPAAFAQMAVVHGTIATISDPHEIANVCGIAGVQYMIDNAAQTPFKCFFGAPSCVPATSFETAGAILGPEDVDILLASPDIWYLAEMMNYPGVLHKDADVMSKLAAATKHGKPVDGHAPGLTGTDAAAYAAAGITTDHECTRLEEALDKIDAGMHILIREGSAAKNFEALQPLLGSHPERVMLCSDDKHPDDLALGHINQLVLRALAYGHDLYDVLRAACINPVNHYQLPVGLLREGDPADFIVVDNPERLQILQTYIGGRLVAEAGKSLLPDLPAKAINNFQAILRTATDFRLPYNGENTEVRVIDVQDGQLVTSEGFAPLTIEDRLAIASPAIDVLKMAVVNRYVDDAQPAIAFIRGFGLQRGAIASTVAHDCHNIIAVGVDDAVICAAINAVINAKGGIAVAESEKKVHCLPLPVAGLMTTLNGYEVAGQYTAIDQQAKSLGATLHAPFMTLSFMALLVIPSLKLSDKGLFDGMRFRFTSLYR
jgi:adenine deaminase